jgi:uncharacterized protein YbgA (DUF1722 family)
MERVKVWNPRGGPARKEGRGLFAEALLAHFPLLPVEEEGRLNDPPLRENFIVRVFAYRRVRDLFHGRWTVGGLVRFHAAEKLLLMAHDVEAYRSLGRLVASAKGRPRADVAREYAEGLLRGLGRPATVKRHANVLQHMAGFLRDLADPEDRREIEGVIDDYRAGLVPLVVPISLFRHHVRRFRVPWLQEQTYLEPHPKELMLRNHA